MTWIVTHSRKEIDPSCPRAEDIDIVDIAHALARTGRFGNHGDHFLSVARHSLDACQVAASYYHAPVATQLQALLHDAAEAYIGDIVGPVKLLLGDRVKQIENRFLRAIGEHVGIDLVHLEPVVKEIDMRLLLGERDTVFNGRYGRPWPMDLDYHGIRFAPIAQKPDYVAAQFIRKYEALKKKLTP